MPYRGRKQRSLSSSIRAQKSSNGRRDVDLGTSPVNELARVLESTHLAVALTERASRNQERPVALAQVSAVNNHRPKAEADIDAYVQGVLAGITPSDADLLLKRNECRRIEVIVQRVLPNTDLKIMGGTANTFALKDSDVDICIVGVHGSRTLDASEVNRLSNELRQKGYVTEVLLHTFVPLIRVFVSSGTSAQIQLELSWSNPIGVYKTELLAAYSGIDERVKRLVQFVKYWAKVRKLSNTRQGGMGSFAWSLTCIYFLMSIALPPILPNLQKTNVTPAYFQGFNVAFSKDMAGSYRSGNEKTLGSLATNFFEFLESFDFHNNVISIRRPDNLITKIEKGWTNDLVRGYGSSGQRVFHSYLIAIEDPFETQNNAARTVNQIGLRQIKSEIARAVKILRKSKEEVSALCEPKLSFY